MRARVLLVVGLIAAAAWFGYRHRERGREPGYAARSADAGGPTADGGPAGRDAAVALPLADPHGASVTLTLLGAPALEYAARNQDDDADAAYRALVDELSSGDVRYDRDLSRAAREVAYQATVLKEPPPESIATALLHASGAAELSAMQLLVHANSDDASVLKETVRRALARPIEGHGPIRVGVGEVTTPDEEMSYHVAVLVTRRAYEVDATPRHAALATTWTLRGTLPPGYSDATGWAMYPDGRSERVDLIVDGRRFELTAPTGTSEGTMYASISGTDRFGPGKLLQLSVEVGREPSRELDVIVPPDDPELPDLAAAEAYALLLLNEDRARFGLAPLVPDARLAAVARAHSVDMRDHGFFAHLSPTTGLANDRLAAAGIRARAHAENLARNDSITEAQASLLASIGHRRNILNPKLTHVGIGLAHRDRDGDSDWYLTQVFTVPVVAISPEEGVASVLATIAARRADTGAGPLDLDAELAAVAQRSAGSAADGDVDDLAERTGEQLRAITHRSASISVHAAYDLNGFDPPRAALDPDMASIGVGVKQSDTDPTGRIGVVVIVSPE